MTMRVWVLVASAMMLAGPALAQGRACDRMHDDYDRASGPKAWVAGPGGCGYATARTANTIEEARRFAMQQCFSVAGRDGGCRLLEAER